MCPIDTPDGESCGLVKNMALTGLVSSMTPEGPVRKLLTDPNIEELGSVKDFSSLLEATKVFLNGRWIGVVADTREASMLANKIRKARRRGPAKVDLTQVCQSVFAVSDFVQNQNCLAAEAWCIL